jgi:hypothetical protein
MRKLILSSLILLTAATLAGASSVADLTEIGVGARPLGMARAFTAMADDGSAIFMNPAGLNSVNEFNLISMSGNLINEIPYLVLGGARRTHLGVFGIGYIGASIGGIREAVLVGSTPEVTGNEADFGNSTLVLSYATEVKNVLYLKDIMFLRKKNAKVGANLKYVSLGFSGAPSFEGNSASGFDLDIGTIIPMDEKLTYSVTVKNLIPGNNVKNDELPMSIIGGVSYLIPDRNLTTAADAELGPRGLAYSLGAEWAINSILRLRGGLSQKPDVFAYAFGVGTRFRGFTFDYAFHTYAELAEFNTHYFSLGYIGE